MNHNIVRKVIDEVGKKRPREEYRCEGRDLKWCKSTRFGVLSNDRNSVGARNILCLFDARGATRKERGKSKEITNNMNTKIQ